MLQKRSPVAVAIPWFDRWGCLQAEAYVQAIAGTAGTTAETLRLFEEKVNQVQDALAGVCTSAARLLYVAPRRWHEWRD